MSTHQNARPSSKGVVQRDLTDGQNPTGKVDAAGPGIDLEALAKKIYDLLKEDLRIERERLGRHRR